MIGSPGDATEERQAITDTILKWNAANKAQGLWVEPVKWETHSTPGLDGRPQGMINEELIPQSDCLIAIFRARAGSPTGKELSGTIEEIREFMRVGKYVVVYFFEGMVPIKGIDPDQIKLIHQFKEEIQQKGLTESYSTVDELQAKLSVQLSGIVKKLTSRPASSRKSGSSRKAAPTSQLSIANKGKGPNKTKHSKAPSSSTRTKVDSSDRWALLGDSFLEAKTVRQNRDGTITAEVPSQSAEVDAAMASLRPHHYGRSKPVPFAHGNDAWIVTVREVESVSEGGEQLWTVVLAPEPVEYGGGSMEMSVQTQGKLYTADEIARMRAGRILLNDPPPLDDNKRPSGDIAMLEEAFLEAQIRGVSTPVTVNDCIIQVIYNEQRGKGVNFLKLARLGAIFMLKAGGVIEHVRKLTLGPVRNGKVHVEFVGVRRKKYVNADPTIIQLEGDCALEQGSKD
ncbi:hypothetical protein ElP_55330 [Tautonia plasticadhaerens]|uniref:DUF4062 domain-containing protein n=2 Tax=Tautonia plasticadhaerens TaxID=2527974 RepID=A0A518H9S1_9BACT|nr:hypothetical protein ElP_55330 [Tautonia plasticadhaerens]